MINFTIMLCNDCEVVHSTNTCWLFGLHRGLSSSFPNSDGISWPFRDLILCFFFSFFKCHGWPKLEPYMNTMVFSALLHHWFILSPCPSPPFLAWVHTNGCFTCANGVFLSHCMIWSYHACLCDMGAFLTGDVPALNTDVWWTVAPRQSNMLHLWSLSKCPKSGWCPR